ACSRSLFMARLLVGPGWGSGGCPWRKCIPGKFSRNRHSGRYTKGIEPAWRVHAACERADYAWLFDWARTKGVPVDTGRILPAHVFPIRPVGMGWILG